MSFHARTAPVDLIVANQLHAVADHYERHPQITAQAIIADPALPEALARDLIATLARHGTATVLVRILKAAGAPMPDELVKRLRATLDQRTSHQEGPSA